MIRLGGIGDVVRTLPAVSSLRAAYAGSQLSWLVEPEAASALAGQPWADEVVVLPRPELRAARERRDPAGALRHLAGFARGLRRRRFDLVLDFHAAGLSALLALLSGARRRVAHARPVGRELAWAMATDRARLVPWQVGPFERNQALVRHLGVRVEPAPRPLHVDPELRTRMAAALGPGAAPVVLHVGGSPAESGPRYPVWAYARVARELRDQLGLPSIVTWGPAADERSVAEALVEASGGAARLAPETGDVGALAALLAGCRLFVGADSGPLQVAALVHTPVVQILGAGDPVECAPWPGTPSRSLTAPGGRPEALEPEAVVRAALELLGSAPTREPR